MPRKCCVEGCVGNAHRTFRLPRPSTDRERFLVWLAACGNTNLLNIPPNKMITKTVCILHFEPKYILAKKLSTAAIPTLLLPESIDVSSYKINLNESFESFTKFIQIPQHELVEKNGSKDGELQVLSEEVIPFELSSFAVPVSEDAIPTESTSFAVQDTKEVIRSEHSYFAVPTSEDVMPNEPSSFAVQDTKENTKEVIRREHSSIAVHMSKDVIPTKPSSFAVHADIAETILKCDLPQKWGSRSNEACLKSRQPNNGKKGLFLRTCGSSCSFESLIVGIVTSDAVC